MLNKIIEFQMQGDTISLNGYSISGGWVKWVIIGAKVDIDIEYDDQY